MPGATDDLLAWLARTADHAGATDADLLARFAVGRDEAAFAALVRRHGPVVYGVCRRLTRRITDAEDAFQATFLVLARKADRIGRPELIGNYLFGVAVRVARKARRLSDRRNVRERGGPFPEPTATPVQNCDVGPMLVEELAELADHYRTAVLLCDLHELPRAKAAELLGIPEGTLSSRLNVGRKKLAERLTRRGAAPAGVVAVTAGGVAEAVTPLLARATVDVARVCGTRLSANALFLATEGGWAVGQVKLLAAVCVAVLCGVGTHVAWSGQASPTPDKPQPPSQKPNPGGDRAEPPTAEAKGIRLIRKFEISGWDNTVWLPKWSHDGQFFTLTTTEVAVYSTRDAKLRFAIPHNDSEYGTWAVGFLPGRSVLVTASRPVRDQEKSAESSEERILLRFWDIAGGFDDPRRPKPARTLNLPAAVGVPRGFFPDGRSVLCAVPPRAVKRTDGFAPVGVFDLVSETFTELGGTDDGEFHCADCLSADWVISLRTKGNTAAVEARDWRNNTVIWRRTFTMGNPGLHGSERLAQYKPMMQTPDGSRLVINPLRWWSPKLGRETVDEGEHGQTMGPLTRDALVLDPATGDDASLRLKDTGPSITSLHSYSRDGKMVAGHTHDARGDSKYCIWDVATGEVRHSWTTGQRKSRRAVFSPSDPILVVVQEDGDPPWLDKLKDKESTIPLFKRMGYPAKKIVELWDVSGLGK